MNIVTLEDLHGKTLVSAKAEEGNKQLRLVTTDGDVYLMYHEQDCCESVWIDDICGSLGDIIGSPILSAYESNSPNFKPNYVRDYEPESETWTFYKIDTEKGGVTIRWCGQSNGYYSESVSFVKLKADGPIPRYWEMN